jgi:hypothetical protein
MAKEIALHDRVEIDGEDVSNLARTANFNSEHEQVDVSGFSVSGADESLAGKTVQSFEAEFFHGAQSHALLYPLHANRTIFPIEWQPQGLVEASREVLAGNAQLLTYNPNATRGSVRVITATFTAADENGLTFTGGS